MNSDVRCLAVIPARGGSKRIPGKNLVSLAGKPLLAYTVEAALESGLFARVVVSTDSLEIAEVARQLGADVPFIRDAALSDDIVPVSAATVDALERLDSNGDSVAAVCQLMPNCPLRTAADVVASAEQFESSGAAAQISVIRFGWQNPWWAMRRADDYTLEPLFPDAAIARSQDLPDLFCPTGAVWWAKSGDLRREGTFHLAGRTGWEIPWQRGVDIDTEDDLEMARVLMSQRHVGG